MAISSNDSISMAVFCDFENVALGVRDAQYEQFDIRPVLERLLVKGSIVVKKAYCDWERYKGFKNAMHEANFELIEIPHVRQSGKNSADIRLVVDALDLCYTKSHVDTFVIISGDSDFSPLVSKLRENAKQVIGVGVKQSTSDLLIANCDEFIFYDDLVREHARRQGKPATRDSSKQAGGGRDEARPRREDIETRRTQALEIAMTTYDALSSERGDGSKLWASVLKDAIKRRRPDFNESYYGFRAFGNLLDEAQARGLLRVGRDERSGTYIYRDSASGDVPTASPVAPAAQPETVSPAAAESRSTKTRSNQRRHTRSTPVAEAEAAEVRPTVTPAPTTVPATIAPEPVTLAAPITPPETPAAPAEASVAAPKPAKRTTRRSKPAPSAPASAETAAPAPVAAEPAASTEPAAKTARPSRARSARSPARRRSTTETPAQASSED